MQFTIEVASASTGIYTLTKPCKNAILVKSIPPRVGYHKGRNFYEIKLNSLTELLEISKEVKYDLIISIDPTNSGALPGIVIYDDYIE